MSKLITFVCVLALALAATTYADNALLIGDWENCFDHWSYYNWGNNYLFGFSGTGATRNSQALQLITPAAQWSGGIYLKLQGYTNLDVDIFGIKTNRLEWFAKNCQYNMLEVDVTRLVKDWKATGSGQTSQLMGLLNWGFAGFTDGNPPANLATGWDMIGPGGSDWDGLADSIGLHCVYDMTQPSGGDPTKPSIKQVFVNAYNEFYASGNYTITDAWCELVFLPFSTGYQSPVTYYLDNAKLTPEPATIALLGLGGLSLLRIRRKR